MELKNLSVKESALDLLDLPFRIIHGTIGVLSANIPWSSIYTSPVVLHMSNILIVAVPDDGKHFFYCLPCHSNFCIFHHFFFIFLKYRILP